MYQPSQKPISREMKVTTVAIYSYQNKELRGTIVNPYFETPLAFNNVMQFVLLMENLLDSIGFPQRTMDLRHAAPKRIESSNESALPSFSETADMPQGSPLATLELEIIFRQNASWQGSFVLREKNSVFTFRSLLELLILIDSLLDAESASLL